MRRELSPAERQRRSELAQRLHEQTIVDPNTGQKRRKFGGAQPNSGRPKKVRASTIVAEAAKEHAQKIKQALLDGIAPEAPIQVRVGAAKTWLDIEAKEEQLEIDEKRMLEGLQRDQLVGQLAEKLELLIDKGLIPREMLHANGGAATTAIEAGANGDSPD